MTTSRLAPGAMLFATLVGCSHVPPTTPTPPSLRFATRLDCRPHANCDVTVNPHAPQWVPEETISRNGQNMHFRVRNNVARFADPGIVFKTPDGAARFPCTRQNDHHVKCDNNGESNVQYPYTVRVLAPNGTVTEYDPFVWNR